MPTPVDPLLNAVIDDPDVARKARQLALAALDAAMDFLGTHQTPQTRMSFVKSTLPVLLKSLEHRSEDQSIAELRASMNELFRLVRGDDGEGGE